MTPSTAIQRPDLGLALEEFDLEASRIGFIGSKVLRVVDVALATANFSRVKLEELLFPDPNTARAPGTGFSRGSGQFTQDNYQTSAQGHEEPVDDDERAIYAYTIDSELLAAKRARDVVMRNYEKRVSAAVMNTTTWATTNTNTKGASVAWTTHATAAPVDDIMYAIKAVYTNFGIRPNAVVLSWFDWLDLVQCSQIIDRIKYSGRDDPKQITTDMIAQLFQVKQIIVGDAVYNAANSGQSASLSPVWPKGYAQVCKVAETDDLREPCIGRTFNFTGNGSVIGGVVTEYREEKIKSDVIRVEHYVGEKVINSQCGFLITGISS